MRSLLIVSSKTTSCLTSITVASRNVAFLVVQSVNQSKFSPMQCGLFIGIHVNIIIYLDYSYFLNFPFLEQNTIVSSNVMIYQLFCLSLAHS